MSKTNHRVNKEREEKLQESSAHKKRRGFKRQASEVAVLYEEVKREEYLLDYLDDDEFETFEAIRRRR